MKTPVSITAISSLSALGSRSEEIWDNYSHDGHFLTQEQIGGLPTWVAQLRSKEKEKVETIRDENSKYKNLDKSVLYAMEASRRAMETAGWSASDNFGVNLGSSRGATELFEKYHGEFLSGEPLSPLASPTTTLGNIASWVAHDLGTHGPEISHSITCSTGLHAVVNGLVWLQSGLAHKFLVGGSEAPLTPFTLAQMKAMKVYAKSEDAEYPCRALDLDKNGNSMVLGEGAAVACLEAGEQPNALAHIAGFGYATETLRHNTSISTDADCFQKSMKMALGDLDPSAVDAVVMHAPGTIKGDMAEYRAISAVFGNHKPLVTTNKWKVGHTFATSGMLCMEFAILMLQHNRFVGVPFWKQTQDRKLQRIMLNAVGFGGNAVSIFLQLPNPAH